MKYFTPDRFILLQDHSDEKRFLAVSEDWEHALEEYWQQLKEVQQKLAEIKPPLPKSLQEFLRFFNGESLHDARVLDMYYEGSSGFRITLQPEFQPERLVVLTYSLCDPPQLHYVLPERLRFQPSSWLYDEITWDGLTREGKPLLRHAILLCDGREVGLSFDSAIIERPTALVPTVPTNGECA